MNLIMLCMSLMTFEVKSMLEDGLAYFSSFWNKNDMMLFVMSIICLVQEISNLKYQSKAFQTSVLALPLRGLEETAEEEAEDLPDIFSVSGFDYKGYYMHYDPHESITRVCYSLLIINTHIKTLNVLSFYPSVAFIIKAMQRVIEEIQGYAVFFFFLVLMYALAYNALDLLWLNSDAMWPEGDYVGMGGMVFATFITTYRISVGDFLLGTFRFLGNPLTTAVWFVFLTQMIIQFFLMMNFAIQIAEAGYGSVASVQIEEAYQKKCAVICELNSVFGQIAKRKKTNILITRECIVTSDITLDTDETATGVKKQQAINKIDTLKSLD